jgi:hypothetical protein
MDPPLDTPLAAGRCTLVKSTSHLLLFLPVLCKPSTNFNGLSFGQQQTRFWEANARLIGKNL